MYKVEEIIQKKIDNRTKKPKYLIKWQGWDSSANTWEPAEHLTAYLIQKFQQRQRAQNSLLCDKKQACRSMKTKIAEVKTKSIRKVNRRSQLKERQNQNKKVSYDSQMSYICDSNQNKVHATQSQPKQSQGFAKQNLVCTQNFKKSSLISQRQLEQLSLLKNSNQQMQQEKISIRENVRQKVAEQKPRNWSICKSRQNSQKQINHADFQNFIQNKNQKQKQNTLLSKKQSKQERSQQMQMSKTKKNLCSPFEVTLVQREKIPKKPTELPINRGIFQLCNPDQINQPEKQKCLQRSLFQLFSLQNQSPNKERPARSISEQQMEDQGQSNKKVDPCLKKSQPNRNNMYQVLILGLRKNQNELVFYVQTKQQDSGTVSRSWKSHKEILDNYPRQLCQFYQKYIQFD